MRLDELFTSTAVDTRAGLAWISDRIIGALTSKTLRTLPEEFALWGGHTLSLWNFPGILLSDVFPNRKGLSRLPAPLRAFIKQRSHLRIGFGTRNKNSRGTYQSNPPEILVNLSDETLAEIKDRLLSQTLGIHTLHTALLTMASVMLHEVTHAYDDWVSQGKFRANARSQASRWLQYKARGSNDPAVLQQAHAAYVADPIEINARYIQTVQRLWREIAHAPWRDLVRTFQEQIGGWRLIPPDEQRRLLVRLATERTAVAKPKPQDFTADSTLLQQRLRDQFGVQCYLSYRDTFPSIHVDEFGTSDPNTIFAMLRAVIRFADIRRLTVAAAGIKLDPDLKRLGFVKNAGRSKRYDLSWRATLYRPAREARPMASALAQRRA